MEPGDALAVLLELRLVGVAPATALRSRPLIEASAFGDRLDAVLAAAARAGWVDERAGRVAGWMLTPAGRARLDEMLGRDLDDRDARAAVEAVYARFLPLNRELLAVCTRWQVRIDPEGREVPNPHDDPDADRATIDALADLHSEAVVLLTELRARLDRFASYPARLGEALARVERGEHDWFARPTIDSYHSVWFELHEHLLATLGRRRTDEPR